MGAADRLVAVLLLGLAIYTVVAAGQLGYWQGRIPGPGFAPLWIGVGLGLAAVWILVRRGAAGVAAAGDRPLFLLQVAGMTAVAVLLVPALGMLTSLALLLLAMVRVLGGSWRAAVVTALALPAAFFLVFAAWLGVPLPKGPWGF